MMDNDKKLKALEKMMAEGERVASPKELDILNLQKNNRELTGLSKNRPKTASMMPDEEIARRMSGTTTLDDIVNKKPSLTSNDLFEKATRLGKGIDDKASGALLDKTKIIDPSGLMAKPGVKVPGAEMSDLDFDKLLSRADDKIVKNTRSKAGLEASESLFSKLASKVGAKGFGKVAGMAVGMPLMLASEAVDASEVGESALDDDMMIAESQARKNYDNSQASFDKRGIEKPYEELTFPQMRALKDGRRDSILEGQKGDAGLREMIDTREGIRDVAGSDKTLEERERLAQKQLDETRKKKGLSHSPIMQDQGEDL
jgi:hypothetical protein